MFEFLDLVPYGSVDLVKGGVYLCFEGVGEALHVGVIHHITFEILEDDLHLLSELFVNLLGLVLQVNQLLLLTLYFVILLIYHPLFPEDLVLGVENRSSEAYKRDGTTPDGLLVVVEEIAVFLLEVGVGVRCGFCHF